MSKPVRAIAVAPAGAAVDRPTGVWSVRETRDWFADEAETIMHWRESPAGQHLELGIAETNLVVCWGSSARSVQLGVTDFGQGGDIDSLCRYHRIDRASIVEAAFNLADEHPRPGSPTGL